MSHFAAWFWTLVILGVMALIPSWVYRWALVCLVLVPIGIALVLAL
jgi:hypothetical protein